jgi:nitric oxide reductase subunit C
MAGPTLAGIASRAEQLVASPDYAGEAEDAAGYIREAITSPSVHLVPGAMYSANGVSFMPNTYPETLSDEQIDDLTAFLASFR